MEATSEAPKFSGAAVGRLAQPAQWPLASDLLTFGYLLSSKRSRLKYHWDFFP